MRVNIFICALLFYLGISGAAGRHHQWLFMNESTGEICFTITENGAAEEESGQIVSIELILNVAYATAETEAGSVMISCNSTSTDKQYIRYEHEITNMTHGLKVWLNNEEVAFSKTRSPRWYYMSKFLDILVLADGPIDFGCSDKNITTHIFFEDVEPNESHSEDDSNSIELIDTEINIEEVHYANLTNDQFVNQNATAEVNMDYAEILSLNFTKYVGMVKMETKIEDLDDTFISQTTDTVKNGIINSDDETAVETVDSFESVENDTYPLDAPLLPNEKVTVLETFDTTGEELGEVTTEYRYISRVNNILETSESTENGTTALYGQLLIGNGLDMTTVIWSNLSGLDVSASTIGSEMLTDNINTTIIHNSSEIQDIQSSTTGNKDMVDEITTTTPITDIESNNGSPLDKNRNEDSTDASFAGSNDGEKNEEEPKKPNITTIYLLTFILGGLFVISIIISIVFHRKRKRLNIEMTNKVVRPESPIAPGESERFITLAHGA